MITTSKNSELVGIVTVLFNSDDVLPGFFESLSNQRGVRYRLYIIDNSKTDSGCQISHKLAEKYNIDVKVVFNDANVGVAQGNNQGIQLALNDKCSHILLSNNDVEFYDENLIEKLIAELDQANASSISPRINYYEPKNFIWYAGGKFSKLRATTPHIGIDKDEKKIKIGNQPQNTDYAPTCFLLLKSSIFKKIGLFDTKYFVYYDDSDFIWRMNQMKFKILYSPNLVIYHKVSSSTGGGESDFSTYYLTRNRIYFINKNYNFILKYLALAFVHARLRIKMLHSESEKKDLLKKAISDGNKMRKQ